MNTSIKIRKYTVDGVVIQCPDLSTSFFGSCARTIIRACDSQGRFSNLHLPIRSNSPETTRLTGRVTHVQLYGEREEGCDYSSDAILTLTYQEFHPMRHCEEIAHVQTDTYRNAEGFQ